MVMWKGAEGDPCPPHPTPFVLVGMHACGGLVWWLLPPGRGRILFAMRARVKTRVRSWALMQGCIWQTLHVLYPWYWKWKLASIPGRLGLGLEPESLKPA